MDAPLALYRRYRPETFAEVIGQDHVTQPLRHALGSNRVHHAYLFSGPRGCGKTTSARILARALNCEKAPIADPCGECQNCRDLARGGPGSIDVIEIDAASHGGVDDARDLRERAFFAPVSSRYKVYIIDEAHMVSTQGFNALLKLVEEPPPHLKFIFATTEPDKVIGTIKSRTHHYPFRLVPPKLLSDYLLSLCEREGVQLDSTALPLVVRAGAGSVRDTLSVLDQLLGGAGPDGITYDLAVQLLGYTPDALLDESIDAFAARDGSTVFSVIDRVIESGQDPRRFAEDLLQRLRDLVIVKAVPDAFKTGLLDVSEDRAERLQQQTSHFGGSELTRAADIVNEALVEFRGATAPRLLLELMSARILVPTADQSDAGLAARLDRLERRMGIDPSAAAPVASPAEPGGRERSDRSDEETTPDKPVASPAVPGGRERSDRSDEETTPDKPVASPAEPGGRERSDRSDDGTEAETVASAVSPRPAPAALATEEVAPEPPAPEALATEEVAPETPAAQSQPGALGIADIRRLWPGVLDRLKERSRRTWSLLSHNAQVLAADEGVLTLGLVNAGARDSFMNSDSVDHLRDALRDILGGDWKIEGIVDPTASGTPPSQSGEAKATKKQRGVPAPESVRQAVESRTPAEVDDPDASADPDDPVVDSEADPEQLLASELGAKIIDESS